MSRSGSISHPGIRRTLLVLAGLLVASVTAGAVLTSGLTAGHLLVHEDTGAARASMIETSPSQFDELTAQQQLVDFRLSEKGLPTRAEELTAQQQLVDFRLSEKGLPTRAEELTAQQQLVDFRLSEKGLPTRAYQR